MENTPPLPPPATLPLHLTLCMLPFMASSAALQLSRGGSPGLRAIPGLANLGGLHGNSPLALAWRKLLESPQAAEAAQNEAKNRVIGFLGGMERYRSLTPRSAPEAPTAVARSGAARLLDYGGDEGGPAVLLIPSLINRYYILDLTARQSFAHYLAGRGMRVFVVDWGSPSAEEAPYDCADYVCRTLSTLADAARALCTGPLVLGGYCMGGLLAMALATVRPELVDGLACFATPWDFTAPEFPRVVLTAGEIARLQEYIREHATISPETIHALFQYAHPYAYQAKLREFATMDLAKPATQSFLAIEGWVNDGVAMAQGVARDCLIDWTQHNAPAKLQWRVGGKPVDPRALRMPSFIAVPSDDRIVPSACAMPLAKLLGDATCISPKSGHVGMMVGSRRKAALWEPFSEWVLGQFA